VFRDSLVPGWPQSTVRGRARWTCRAAREWASAPSAVDAATIDLGTVRRLVPAVPALQGVLDAAGTLTGRLADAQLQRHAAARPVICPRA